MTLTSKQKRHLRAAAHALKPVVLVGQAGITSAVTSAVDEALRDHELIKVRIHGVDRAERATMIAALREATGADLIASIGHVAVLFRRNPERPRVAVGD